MASGRDRQDGEQKIKSQYSIRKNTHIGLYVDQFYAGCGLMAAFATNDSLKTLKCNKQAPTPAWPLLMIPVRAQDQAAHKSDNRCYPSNVWVTLIVTSDA